MPSNYSNSPSFQLSNHNRSHKQVQGVLYEVFFSFSFCSENQETKFRRNFRIFSVFLSVYLFGCLIKTHEHLDRFASNFKSSGTFLTIFSIDATDRSKISSNQKRLFIAVSLYPLSFFANIPFKTAYLGW